MSAPALYLNRIRGENFRLLTEFDLQPHPGLNLVLGPNAAGKTSFLEAIHTLGRGRSFRGSPVEVTGAAAPHWRLLGQTESSIQPPTTLAVSWSPAGLQVRSNQAEVPLQELVRQFPVQILEPDSHRLLDDGPAYRRRYLDWGVFHVEHPFFPAWRRYQRALRQRNRALKTGLSREQIEAWNTELQEAGEEIQACRERHLEVLRIALTREIHGLLGDAEWTLELARGWPAQKTLADSLAEHYEQDRRQGQTVCGPHRAELRLRFDGRGAKHQVSRGQQKLLVAALLLAQARLIARHTGAPPVLLVDDFPAELGPEYQQALLAALEAYPGQVFLTAIEPTGALKSISAPAVFHVEHGRFFSP